MIRRSRRSTLFPYTTLFRSALAVGHVMVAPGHDFAGRIEPGKVVADRKSTRLNYSHTVISYAVFCLKKKKNRRTLLHRINGAQCSESGAVSPVSIILADLAVFKILNDALGHAAGVLLLMLRPPPISTRVPYAALFR